LGAVEPSTTAAGGDLKQLDVHKLTNPACGHGPARLRFVSRG